MEVEEEIARSPPCSSTPAVHLITTATLFYFSLPQGCHLPPHTSMPSPLRTRYIWSQALQDASDQLPANLGRSSLVHGLIQALSLLESNHPDDPSASEDSWRAVVVPPDMTLGTEACLRRYHDAAYVGP